MKRYLGTKPVDDVPWNRSACQCKIPFGVALKVIASHLLQKKNCQSDTTKRPEDVFSVILYSNLNIL
jgi:hypothetical protein